MSPAWSYVLTAVGVLGLLLAGSRKRVGWALGLAAQPLWAIYAVVTGQWGFIVSAVVYGGVYLRNWLKWRREAQRVSFSARWATFREQMAEEARRERRRQLSAAGFVPSSLKPSRTVTPPAPDVGRPLDPNQCDPATGRHSTPHRGCILR